MITLRVHAVAVEPLQVACLSRCAGCSDRCSLLLETRNQTPLPANCLDSLVVPTRLFSHALHYVVLRGHDDRVEDGSAE